MLENNVISDELLAAAGGGALRDSALDTIQRCIDKGKSGKFTKRRLIEDVYNIYYNEAHILFNNKTEEDLKTVIDYINEHWKD